MSDQATQPTHEAQASFLHDGEPAVPCVLVPSIFVTDRPDAEDVALISDGLDQFNVTRFGIAIAKNPDTRYGVYWAMEIAAETARPAPSADGAFMSLSGGEARATAFPPGAGETGHPLE